MRHLFAAVVIAAFSTHADAGQLLASVTYSNHNGVITETTKTFPVHIPAPPSPPPTVTKTTITHLANGDTRIVHFKSGPDGFIRTVSVIASSGHVTRHHANVAKSSAGCSLALGRPC